MSREVIGRLLCFGLGVLFTAGAVPLFNFGEAGQWIWNLFNTQAQAIAGQFGIPGWIASLGLGLLSVGGPIGLVWLIAGKQVNRTLWFLYGIAAYAVSWMMGLRIS